MQVSTVFSQATPEANPVAIDDSTPFRILVMGDFGADKAWGKPRPIDRDNFDEVFSKLNVKVEIAGDANLPRMTVRLEEPDGFHPDRLYQQLEVFESLRARRQRLENDDTFADEAAAIRQADQSRSEGERPAVAPADVASAAVDPSDILDQAVQQTSAAQLPIAEQIAKGSVNVDQLVRQIVAPYVLDKADPRKPEFIAAVDSAISEVMRRVLHSPEFQQVEAAWQGVRMLIRRLETDASLQVSLLNVSQQDLAEDLCADDDLTRSKLYQLLVEETSVPGSEPWALVVGSYTFDNSLADTACLGRVAQVHAATRSVFVAGAEPRIVGANDLAATPHPNDWGEVDAEAQKRWNELRQHPAAAHVVLTMPRVLGRRPYGAESDPIDEFRFEEIPDGTAHNAYLWVNSAFAVATMIGQGFSTHGWACWQAWQPSFDGLPIFIYEDEDGDSVVQPCGEVELILSAGEVLSQVGITAVHSVRGDGAVLIPAVRLLSSADDAATFSWQ
ncbi:type VI secretion system contractile sheath domain-containing protein [Fuerstiella marisgermanici]|uniref:Type VI secretion protein, EvpB/ family n=1 Tax=Fuerstiella marisgermanici TaxID=1891926 RepID=A0A1P8WR54_9PLAN|nr:type VI secretion system contractile sheath large subunit [Fuerstiella marisgermanici]APZ96546.1 type VI secretion protein, EvpB/ family [Fuerstiella marisgermanici]